MRAGAGHALAPPSDWIVRWASLIRPGGAVLDLACGSGRHARWLATLGFEVDAVDRDAGLFLDPPPGVALTRLDLKITRPGSGEVLAEADLPLGPI